MVEFENIRFEWDKAKNRRNKNIHNLSFETAVEVFADPFAFTIPDRYQDSEERFWTVGRLRNLVITVVVHTSSDDKGEVVIRVISARRATPQERQLYEET